MTKIRQSLPFVVALAVIGIFTTPAPAATPIPIYAATACEPVIEVATRKVPPKYPQDQLYQDANGWAMFILTTSPDGTVREARALDSVGSPRFREAAREAYMQWRFQTATRNGVAIERYVIPAQINFMIHEQVPSSSLKRAFVAAEALPGDDHAGRLAILEKAQGLPMSAIDRLHLSLALARESIAIGDTRRALYHVRHANADKGQSVMTKDLASEALRLRAELEASDGNLREAVCFSRLARELTPNAPEGPSDKIAAEALARLNTPAPLVVSGTIFAQPESELPPAYIHGTTRAAFTAKAVSGSIEKIRVVCPLDSVERPWTNGVVWTVPDPAAWCYAFVFGAPGTRIELTETW